MVFSDIEEANIRVRQAEKDCERAIKDKEILRNEAKEERARTRALLEKVKKETGKDYKEFYDSFSINKISDEKNILEYPDRLKDGLDFSEFCGKTNSITVIVCVHNALNDVVECLLSLTNHYTFPFKLILVDDGSDADTKNYLTAFSKIIGCELIRNDTSKGYTVSANIGLSKSKTEFSVLLNSDTIVTEGWLEKMLNCMLLDEKIGIVSPLSNAASWQSVPYRYNTSSGDWMINSLDSDKTYDLMSLTISDLSMHLYPSVEVLNGFCMMIRNSLIDEIGLLDEKNFPRGYGEEVDFCLRAKKAGYILKVVDDAYIFHEKSKSFTHETRKILGKESKDVLMKKYGAESYGKLNALMEKNGELNSVRDNIRINKDSYSSMPIMKMKIAFLLTTRGGNGGANSVVQEVLGMRKLGVQAYIINSSNYSDSFNSFYPELSKYVLYFDKNDEESLYRLAVDFDYIIATVFTTVKLLHKISLVFPDIYLGYYIQDYEPYFFEKTDELYKEAEESYSLIPNMCRFAKTRWISDMVKEKHKQNVYLVKPSVDISIYNPYIIEKKEISDSIVVSAMIRPKTPRRNALGTLKLLKKIKEKYGDLVEINIFGCSISDLDPYKEVLDYEYVNHGILTRIEVANVLLHSNMFVDMSTYQAFGRTTLEAMALGCISVIPQKGGACLYAKDNVNSIVVDTGNIEETYLRIIEILSDKNKYYSMQKEALITARGYDVLGASISELIVLNNHLENELHNPQVLINRLMNQLKESKYENTILRNQNEDLIKKQSKCDAYIDYQNEIIENLRNEESIYKKCYEDISNATFWKISSPVRHILDYIKK